MFAQDLGGPILSNFEKEFYASPKGVILNYTYVNHHSLNVMGEFFQVFTVERSSIDGSLSNQKALVISQSTRRKTLGRHDYIDSDEVPELINALAYYLKNLADTKPEQPQAFVWTSRGGFQIKASYSNEIPRRYILTSKMDHLSTISNSVVFFNRQIEEIIISLKAANVMLN